MGVLYLTASIGDVVFVCGNCSNFLTNRDELISTEFRGQSGQAFLFKKVYNVTQSPMYRKQLISGEHFIRDVFCKKCSVKLGWFYEFSRSSTLALKEGKTCLEREYLTEQRGIGGDEDDAGAQPAPRRMLGRLGE